MKPFLLRTEPIRSGEGRYVTTPTQEVTKATTTSKRQCLTMAYGLLVGDVESDDLVAVWDGAEAVTDEQAANIQALLDELGEAVDLTRFRRFFQASSAADVPQSRYDECVAFLERKRAEQ